MSLKPLTILAAFSFCLQVIFSIIYSIKVVDLSQLANVSNQNLTQATIINQQLEINLSELNSLSTLFSQTEGKNYTPVNTVVNLN